MWSVKKIMVPTDFGAASQAAVDAAIELARKFDASIVLMHAYQIPVYTYPSAPLTPIADLNAHVENAADKVLNEAASAARKSGVPVTTVLRVGSPWEQILRATKEQECGLIVMGSRGLHGLPRALMGSTAERVVRHSPVPVMTLHGPLPKPGPKEAAAKAADDLVDQWLI
jgi:nucleotide-binding universal stress UspA family protein